MTSPSPVSPRITIKRNRTPLVAVEPGGSHSLPPLPSLPGSVYLPNCRRGVCDPLRPGFFFAPSGESKSAFRFGKVCRRQSDQEGQGQQNSGGLSFGAGHEQTVRGSDSAVSLKAKQHFSSGYVP